MNTAYAYAPLVKHYRDEAGDLVVTGRATGPELDLDQQVCDPDWLKTAVPEWFTTGANVREQHTNLAAGVGEEITATGDGGWDLKSVVVDAGSAKKVERGVLKGYSIGVRAPKIVKDAAAPRGRIVGGQIVEISLVDRPANPTCTLMLAKAATPGSMFRPGQLDTERMLLKVEELHEADDVMLQVVDPAADTAGDVAKRQFTADQRHAAAKSGAAMKDGAFPIKTVGDLKNAIQAVGRAKDPAAAKAHIKARAQALGKENLIPDSWKAAAADATKAAPDGMWVHDPGQLAQVRAALVALIKAELDELDGGERELGDISELMSALSLFLCWWQDESRGDETTSPYTGDTDDTGGPLMAVGLSASADTTKNTTTTTAEPDTANAAGTVETREGGAAEKGATTAQPAAAAADTAKTSATDLAAVLRDAVAAGVADALTKASKKKVPTDVDTDDTGNDTDDTDGADDGDDTDENDKNENDKAALADVLKALTAKVDGLDSRLTKAETQPAPGGPVLTRTTDQATKAAANEGLLTKATQYERLASEVSDRDLAGGYREMAKSLRAQATAPAQAAAV